MDLTASFVSSAGIKDGNRNYFSSHIVPRYARCKIFVIIYSHKIKYKTNNSYCACFWNISKYNICEYYKILQITNNTI